jgi:phosphate-selective porin OprO/OprP
MYDYNKAENDTKVDEDGFDIRRARIYVKGTIAKDWAFKSQFNLTGDTDVEDLYIRYQGWGPQAVVTVGKQKMPFMLEQMTSSKDISVLERSAITERYLLGRKEGIVLSGAPSNNSSYSIGAYLETFTPAGADDEDSDIGLAARYTIAPIKTENSLVHIGVGYKDISYQAVGGDTDEDGFGIELAGVYAAYHAQIEWVDASENDVDVDGYYVQLGYVLTGETRPYKQGAFKRIKPEGAHGAWEIVARYEDGDGNYSDIELGSNDAHAYTIGVNWYAHQNVRFGINYTDGERENDDLGGSEFRIRAQLTF